MKIQKSIVLIYILLFSAFVKDVNTYRNVNMELNEQRKIIDVCLIEKNSVREMIADEYIFSISLQNEERIRYTIGKNVDFSYKTGKLIFIESTVNVSLENAIIQPPSHL